MGNLTTIIFSIKILQLIEQRFTNGYCERLITNQIYKTNVNIFTFDLHYGLYVCFRLV